MEELNQRSDNWSGPDPRGIRKVGQDRTYGGVGAFWVPSLSKLTAYRDERMLTVIFFVPGVDDRRSSPPPPASPGPCTAACSATARRRRRSRCRTAQPRP